MLSHLNKRQQTHSLRVGGAGGVALGYFSHVLPFEYDAHPRYDTVRPTPCPRMPPLGRSRKLSMTVYVASVFLRWETCEEVES
jgi:hypothetical protein